MSIWKATKLLLTLHCAESTRLISDGLDSDLSAVERWAVRFHAISCRQCRRFGRQVRFLHEAGRRRGSMQSECRLPPKVREQIAARLREEGK